MQHVDIFNGDADGICALAQLRSAEPVASRLVTGVKRDIELVAQAAIGPGDRVTVLDVSLDKNREAVLAALDRGATVFYCDHHHPGEIPTHPNLTTRIDTDPETCTALLMHAHLGGRFPHWAITGAFGDNMDARAHALCDAVGVSADDRATLQRLGVCINYNGYGADLADLHFPPAELFERLRPFADPRTFVAEDRATFDALSGGYDDDMARVAALEPIHADASAAVFLLPDARWARRVSGVFGNDLANAHPDRAHAVLTTKADGTLLVSVRSPLTARTGADALCRRYPTGGGRAAAAGINSLPGDQLDAFVTDFCAHFRR